VIFAMSVLINVLEAVGVAVPFVCLQCQSTPLADGY